jgi:hypothetical protein
LHQAVALLFVNRQTCVKDWAGLTAIIVVIATASVVESPNTSSVSDVSSLDSSIVVMAAAVVATAAVAAAARLNFHPVSSFFKLYTWGSSSAPSSGFVPSSCLFPLVSSVIGYLSFPDDELP